MGKRSKLDYTADLDSWRAVVQVAFVLPKRKVIAFVSPDPPIFS